ncbi:MAG: LysR family transcriptional regulator [Solirubrobacteraceae bacterium]
MLDARRLTTLQAVLRTGSFAAAAAELGYTQSAVSQHIAELERATGLRLLDRRPVRPTEAGLVALRAADAAGEALAAAATELGALRDGAAGSVRLGTFASAATGLAAPALATFARTHPGVTVAVAQLEPAGAHEALVAGRIDLAITFDYDVAPQEPPGPVERVPLAGDPVLAALPRDHRFAARRTVELAELADEPWIAAPLAGLPLALLRDAAHRAGFRAAMEYDGDDFRAVLALVAAGLGLAVLPRLALHAAPGTVAVRPLADAPLTRRLYLARLRTARTPPAVAALEAAIRAQAT